MDTDQDKEKNNAQDNNTSAEPPKDPMNAPEDDALSSKPLEDDAAKEATDQDNHSDVKKTKTDNPKDGSFFQNKKVLIIIASIVLIISLLGGASWFVLSKTDPESDNKNEIIEAESLNPDEMIQDKILDANPIDEQLKKEKELAEKNNKESEKEVALEAKIHNGNEGIIQTEQLARSKVEIVDEENFFNKELKERYHHTGSKTPKICLIVQNLGLNAALTEQAIKELPSTITLAFSAYTTKVEKFIRQARLTRHELLLSVPMEPYDYPANDTGALSMLTGVDASSNLQILQNLLNKFLGIQGVIGFEGDMFLTSEKDLKPILQDLQKENLIFIDPGTAVYSKTKRVCQDLSMRCIGVDRRTLSSYPNIAQINNLLQNLENLAFETGWAVGIIDLTPESLSRIKTWSTSLAEKKITLASATSLIDTKKK